eukprot:gene8125-1453_t
MLTTLSESSQITMFWPFVGYMVAGFGIPVDEAGFYAGFIASSFSFAQFASAFFWNRASDYCGRRPVILMGLLANTLTVPLFGFSKALWWAIGSRVITGHDANDPADSQAASICAPHGPDMEADDPVADTSGDGMSAILEESSPTHLSTLQVLRALMGRPPAQVALIGYSVVAFMFCVFDECASLWAITPRLEGGLDFQEKQGPKDYAFAQEQQLYAVNFSTPPYKKQLLGLAISAVVFFIYPFSNTFMPVPSEPELDSEDQPEVLNTSAFLTTASTTADETGAGPGGILFGSNNYTSAGHISGRPSVHYPPALWVFTCTLSVLKAFSGQLCFTSVFVMISGCAPKELVASANGIGQSFASLARALAPPIGGVVFAWSVHSGLPYPLDYHIMFQAMSLMSIPMILISFVLVQPKDYAKRDTTPVVPALGQETNSGQSTPVAQYDKNGIISA